MTTKKKPQPAKRTLPREFKIDLQWVVMHPPPTSLEKCPRCEKPHKKFKPLAFTRPMRFFDLKTGNENAQASYWLQCPKTKEPVIFFDRMDTGGSIMECGRWAKTQKSTVSVKAELSDMKTWVYDPNAPTRIVPGTKAEATAQAARVKVQAKAAKGGRKR